MTETDRTTAMIGKIKLDLTHYPGEDKYCDGEIEDTLLQIARDRSEVEFGGIIEESKSWPILYHLSPLRENIVEWLPIDKTMKVLEVGAGCGAITGVLARKAAEVTCIDLSKKRSMINAYRHMHLNNITIKVGNFMDIEPDLETDFDYVCLIGVFEYGQTYTGGETPYEDLLRILKKHCKQDGHIVIAIENKFGLKYWAGCAEDHLGTYFSGLEGYPDGGVVRTFTRRELEEIAEACGCKERQVFYPYPDYKFMVDLYSDRRLPKVGELKNNLRNFDRDRLKLFDEKLVYDNLLKEEEFPLFSNSYMMILGPQLDISYVRYSNDRAAEYQVKTVERVAGGRNVIEKHALSKEAEAHVKDMAAAEELLKNRYQGGKLEINNAALSDDGSYITFDYVDGVTLEKLLDDCLASGDEKGFMRLFDEYLERISYGEEYPVTDYDLIFSNILVSGSKWTVIDYEWTFAAAIAAAEIAFRALYCYVLEDERREKFEFYSIFEKLGLSDQQMSELRRKEMQFQKRITGKRMSMDEIRDAIGYELYGPESFSAMKKKDIRGMVQIYEDNGGGFSEEQSGFFEGGEITASYAGGVKALRIDPCSDYALVNLRELKWNERDLLAEGVKIVTNGIKLGESVYAFDTQDPNMTISLEQAEQKDVNELSVNILVTRLPEETAKKLCKKSFLRRLI